MDELGKESRKLNHNEERVEQPINSFLGPCRWKVLCYSRKFLFPAKPLGSSSSLNFLVYVCACLIKLLGEPK